MYQSYLQCRKLADLSVEIKSRAVRYFLNLFGDIDARDVSFGHVEDYQSWLSKGRSGQSVNIYMDNLKPLFSWAVKRKFIDVNPFVDCRRIQVGQVKRDLYAADEIQRLLDVSNLRWKVFILLALTGGLRRSEILNLCVADFRFDKNHIVLTPKKDTKTTWQWGIKDRDMAYVPFPEFVHKPVIEIIERLPVRQPYVCVKPCFFERLMQMKSSGGIPAKFRNCPYGNFSRDFKILRKKAMIKQKRFHDLRGTFGTTLAMNGLTLSETQKLMRHSSPQTTAKYYICLDEQNLVKKSNIINKKYYATNVP